MRRGVARCASMRLKPSALMLRLYVVWFDVIRCELIRLDVTSDCTGIYKVKVIRQQDLATVREMLSKTFKTCVLYERELYDCLHRSSCSELLVSVVASAQ